MSGNKEQNEAAAAELAELQAIAEKAKGDADLLVKDLLKHKLVTQAEVDAADFDPAAKIVLVLGEAIAERNALKRSLTAQKGVTTKTKDALEQLEASSKPRKVGEMDMSDTTAAELAELLADVPRVEIAFSDGKVEIAGVPPVAVAGSKFEFRRGRLMLNVPDLTVRGPDGERGNRALLGYALLIDGEQIAWLPRLGGQLTLGAGKTYQMKGDVILV